jgi:hypothetical protein
MIVHEKIKDLNYRNVIFIRFNPDDYINNRVGKW